MNVVWLKKDARIHDNGPLALAVRARSPFCIIYMYEPDQLSHPTLHGSHINFCNEGLSVLDELIRGMLDDEKDKPCIIFRIGEATDILADLNKCKKIKSVFAHEETGHGKSFERDKRVRRFCRKMKINFKEVTQNGVTRGLKDRDKFTLGYNKFMQQPQYPSPGPCDFVQLCRGFPSCGIQSSAQLADLGLISNDHKEDRVERQAGGETLALQVLQNWLTRRGEGYQRGISSPSLAWNSCSRLSAYLTFGHISNRRVVHELIKKQKLVRKQKKAGRSFSKDSWPRSLASFHSRLRWRSHFIQKLESEPDIEYHSRIYDTVRCGKGEHNEEYFVAWKKGLTGFPMVDACMRCLSRHGWLNFRMRAMYVFFNFKFLFSYAIPCLTNFLFENIFPNDMVVSFAAYNLWLDWRVIGKHLARCFLDYEPGIHYPQLQMQSGVTGINAMRVYSVTKQGKDHDKYGTFIRKYIPELSKVTKEWIHEPSKMPASVQKKFGVCIIRKRKSAKSINNDIISNCRRDAQRVEVLYEYPAPIVDAVVTARKGKEVISCIKKQAKAIVEAKNVLTKHGSRMSRNKKKKSKPKHNIKKTNNILSMLKRSASSINSDATPSNPNKRIKTNKQIKTNIRTKPNSRRTICQSFENTLLTSPSDTELAIAASKHERECKVKQIVVITGASYNEARKSLEISGGNINLAINRMLQ